MADIPKAITRKDMYYSYLINGSGELPVPVTRQDFYLHYLCTSGFGGGGSQVTQEMIDAAVKNYLDAHQTAVPRATYFTAGIVKPDGTTITIDDDGTIHAAVTAGSVQHGTLELVTDQTAGVPFTFINQDDITEEEITWNQEP